MGIRETSRLILLCAVCLAIISVPTCFYAMSQGFADTYSIWAVFIIPVSNFVTLAVLWLHMTTVSKVRKLGDDVNAISGRNDLGLRVRVIGSDELAELARQINTMLSSLEEAQEYLVVARDAAEASDRAKSSLIEQLRRRDLELVRARQAAERASSAKSDFLANTSHEIRTPINNIIGFAEVLAESVRETEPKRYVNLIHSSADSLLHIVNDILDLSKIEARRLDIIPRVSELRPLLGDIVERFRTRAEKRQIELKLHISENLPESVLIDDSRLTQVLSNLIDNAIKFTPPQGQVGLEVLSLNKKSRVHEIQFRVTDTGIGISKSAQKTIFDAFEQADTSATRQYGGTGLGLAICSRLVALLGGEISLESTLGTGSTFSFTLCLEQSPALTERPRVNTEEPVQLKRRALVVEDNAMSRELAVRRLKKFGFEVEVAETGAQAVSLSRELDFDIIFMDCQMPDMDGFQTTALIRQAEMQRQTRCPIIALTAHAMEGYREQCLEAGMDDFLTKPIKEQELGEFLRRFETPQQISIFSETESPAESLEVRE